MGQKKTIVLTGFMGSGKSTTAVRLSYRLHETTQDMDKMIERREGRSISEIFATEGEEYFRRLETQLLRELAGTFRGKILSVGGGTPLRAENRKLLRQIGRVVYLRIRPETVYERLKNDTIRPLLQCEDPLLRIRELLAQRREAYEACADVIVDVDDKNMEDILEEIVSSLRRNPGRERNKAAGKGTERQGGRRPLLVINGPNINFLGIREKAVYGTQDYRYLLDLISRKGKESGCAIEVYQSNHEGAIIDRIQAAYFDGTEGIIINPGAYTHYSYAIRDALASITVPKVEVHISDISSREEFRKISVTAPVCDRQIYGQGLDGYLQAVDICLERIRSNKGQG